MGANYDGFLTTTFDNVVNWSRKFLCFNILLSLPAAAWNTWLQPVRIMTFPVSVRKFSLLPRQSDVLWVVGTITHKMTPVLKTVYEQMAEPKWVIAFGLVPLPGFLPKLLGVAGH